MAEFLWRQLYLFWEKVLFQNKFYKFHLNLNFLSSLNQNNFIWLYIFQQMQKNIKWILHFFSFCDVNGCPFKYFWVALIFSLAEVCFGGYFEDPEFSLAFYLFWMIPKDVELIHSSKS